MHRNILSLPVKRFEAGVPHSFQDLVTVEEPLQVRVDGRDLAIIMRTPGHDEELAAGFLFSEGLIRSATEIISFAADGRGGMELAVTEGIGIDSQARRFFVNSACGVCGRASIDALQEMIALQEMTAMPLLRDRPLIARSLIASLPQKLRAAQSEFNHTGGLHAAAVFDAASGELMIAREDIGRHNAVDKVIGALFLRNELPLRNCILALSGRISFELVQKAVMAGIPAIVAVGAPSSLAVETARRFGLTLAGFVRSENFNVYAGIGRIEE